MKSIQTIKLITSIVILLGATSCQKPTTFGFLSDNIASKVDTIFVDRGITTTSQPPFYDLSTRPYNFSFGQVRIADNTTESTQIFEEKEVRLWKDAFVPREDTTEAQVMAKLQDTLMSPLIMNPLTGVMQFTTATKYVDEADIFNIDLNVSNIAGEKYLDNFAVVKMSAQGNPVKVTVDPYVYYILKGDNGKTHNGFNFILNTSEEKARVIDGTGDYYRVNKLSDEPTVGIKVYLRLVDKNGDYIGGKLKTRWYPAYDTFLPHYGDNSVNTIESDTGFEYNFPMVPWPAKNFMWDDGLCYYLTNDFTMAQLDTAAMFTDPTIGDIPVEDRRPTDFESYQGFYLSLKFGIRIMESGTWEIAVQLPFITKD